MSTWGTVKACSECGATDVDVKAIMSLGPTDIMEWDEEKKGYKYVGQEDNSKMFYTLECGHQVSGESIEHEKPTTVRWYPEERKD